jgi:phasin family protein
MLHRSKTVEQPMTGTTKDTAKKPRAPAKARQVKARPTAVPAATAAGALESPPAPTTPLPPPAKTTPRSPPTLTLIPTSPFYTPILKDTTMATAFETTKDTVAETVKATVSQFNETAEAAMTSSKEAMEKITSQAKDAAETSMKSIEEMTDLARGNVEAMLASARVAAAGFETLAAHISDVSRKSFEATTTAARAMTSAKTPNEMFQLQSDFAKTQFDHAVSEFSKMTEMMVKMSGEVMEPVQNRIAVANDKMKTVLGK